MDDLCLRTSEPPSTAGSEKWHGVQDELRRCENVTTFNEAQSAPKEKCP